MKTKQKEYLEQGNLAIVDQGQKLIGGYSDDIRKKVNCKLPVIVFGDHTRAVKLITFPFGAGADGTKILEPSDDIYSKYLFYGTKYLVIKMPDKGYARHYQHLEKMDLPLPSLDEQKRIVAQIEELFSELDNAEATLQATKQQLAVYRQAVLKEAFGQCNTKVQISDACKSVSDGDHMPPPKADQGIPFIMISNIENNKVDWSDTAYVNRKYFDAIDEKRKPHKGDVLYTVTGSYGIPVLVDYDKEFCFQRHIALLRPSESIEQKFLYYALRTPEVYAQATKVATGTAQKTVGLTVLRKIVVPYSDSSETRNRIVREVEERLSECDSIEQTVDTTLLQLQSMHQSVLKEAFEGRL